VVLHKITLNSQKLQQNLAQCTIYDIELTINQSTTTTEKQTKQTLVNLKKTGFKAITH